MAEGYDVWDKARRSVKPKAAQASPSEAAVNTQMPPWINRTRMKMGAPPGAPYEEGDPDIDAFNRKRNMGGPDEDDPFPDVYKKQEEFDRMMQGAYNAGANGDTDALNSFPNTPFGNLMRRAYEEGRKRRGRR